MTDRDNYALIESPAEKRLLHMISKGYRSRDIQAQRKVGPYRLDFYTADGVGWEVDGKMYHQNKQRDEIRDARILVNSRSVHRIVRIPAALMIYFPHATMTALKRLIPGLSEMRDLCDPLARWQRDAERLSDRRAEEGIDDEFECQECFREGETYVVHDDRVIVGCPVAFLDPESWLAEGAGRVCFWTGAAVVKRRNNAVG